MIIRGMAEMIYADPSFEIGSSSGLVKYVGKAQPPTGTNVTFVYTSVYNAAKVIFLSPFFSSFSLFSISSISSFPFPFPRG